MHSSPLMQPGVGDSGGMNVYLDRLSRTMAGRGVDVTVFTRRFSPDIPEVVEVEPGYRVVHITTGPVERLASHELASLGQPFSEEVLRWTSDRGRSYDLVHSHYWLSGRAGVRLKRALSIPLANSFHTLGKVKDANRAPTEEVSSRERLLTEREVVANSDCLISSTPHEFEDLLEHYGATPERLCISPPGVDHDVFHPKDKQQARSRLGFGDRRIVLFVGRIQAHKGTSTAVEALADIVESGDPTGRLDAELHIVGGASGSDGAEELRRCEELMEARGIGDRVRFFEPERHPVLADHYNAADVVIVPSRTESFGLVAAEAQACGVPVVAANTGGLPFVVNRSESGLLVDGHDPRAFATAVRVILEHPFFADRLSAGAVEFSKRFSWDVTASRLLELYDGITT